jgi:hypothetical protein
MRARSTPKRPRPKSANFTRRSPYDMVQCFTVLGKNFVLDRSGDRVCLWETWKCVVELEGLNLCSRDKLLFCTSRNWDYLFIYQPLVSLERIHAINWNRNIPA